MRAKHSVWWPAIPAQLNEAIANCRDCARDTVLRKESLMQTPLPEYPWQVVGTDLFMLKGAC